jgi:transposase
VCWGVEGTGAWGAGLARYLAGQGQQVLDIQRPDRASRRRHGKSDALDAEQAARAALARVDVVIPKRQDGRVEMLRAVRVARRSAMRARIQAGQQLQALLTRAPEEPRASLRGRRTVELVSTAAAFRPGPGPPTTVLAATKLALRELARR